jgi:hypothetical protein
MLWVKPLKIVLPVFMLVLVSCAPVVGDGAHGSGESEKMANWTFMVYLDADNNLEGAGIEDLNEMEMAGSTDNVNIIVQFDRHLEYDTSNGDWTTAKRFRVLEDSQNKEIVSEELMDIGEVNMGDPAVLFNFTKWTIDNYPARHYALVLWNHGGSFWGVAWDEDTNGSEEHDMISMPDLKEGLASTEAYLGHNLDLIGFDACLMANVAVLHQLRNHVNVAVGSGYVEPGEGWPYEKILPELVKSPYMLPSDLGSIIADKYVESYSDRQGDPDDSFAITMAAFDMKKFVRLSEKLSLMGMMLSMRTGMNPVRGGHYFQIQQARSDTNSYDMIPGDMPGNQIPVDPTGYCMYDVIDLMDNLETWLPRDTELVTMAGEVRDTARETIIRNRATGYQEAVKGANGLTVYFPSGKDTVYSEVYSETDFAIECYWDDFLFHYIAKESVDNTPPVVSISEPRDDEPYDLDRGNIAVSGSAIDLQGDVTTVEYSVNEGEWITAAGTNEWSLVLNTEVLGKGMHNVTVRATDGSGESGMSSMCIKVQEPPVEKTTTPATGVNPWIASLGIVVALVIIFLVIRKLKTGKRSR